MEILYLCKYILNTSYNISGDPDIQMFTYTKQLAISQNRLVQ